VLAGRSIRHIDFETLVLINQKVVALTKEKHEYTTEDEDRIRQLLKDVEMLGGADPRETVLGKAALLMFRIASGQYFHEGNKRTALVAGLSFLQMNGLTADIEDPNLVGVVDRAGVANASLKDVQDVLRGLIRSD
jgi:death-on-curing family protein